MTNRRHFLDRRITASAARTAAALLAAVLGVALAAVPAFAWDSIYGNHLQFIGPSVEFQSHGYWNVEEGDSVTVRFGKYNNLLMDSTMGFAARACTTCNVENAVAGVDFHTATGSASFPGNGHPRTSSDFTIQTIENNKVDGKRCFYIDIDWSGKVNYTSALNWLIKHTKSGRQTHVMCILDDDKPPPQPPQPSTVGVSVSNASVEEGGTMTFTVAIAMAVGASFTVQPAITHSTTESGDFSFTAPELSFAGTGAESKTFTVQTTEDSHIEGAESFDVALTLVSKPSNNGKLNLGTGRGTIRDDDYPELTISDASTAEGGRLDFTLTLDDAIPPGYSAFYVQPAITAGTATANSDYVAATPPMVRFQGTRNETKTVTVVTLADTVQDEPDETLTLSASAVSSAPVITTDTGAGTIRERTYSATRKPALAISGGGNVNEGSSVSWTVTLNKAASGPFTVTPDFTGTATGTTDYTVTAGSLLSFAGAANEAKTITIKALKDGTSESDETVLLGLTANRTDRVDDTATGSATIKNVDAPTKKRADWTVEITMGDATVTEGGTVEVDVDVYASNPHGYSCANLSFNGEATVLGGTATSGSDYSEIRWKGYGKSKQLGCANGHTVTHKLEVRTIGDSLLEGDETIEIGLKTHGVYNVGPIGNQWYRQLGNGVHGVVTITDDDTAGVSAANVRVDEGATASVTVTATGSAVEGGYTLAPTLTAARTGTLAGRDYGEHPASLTFAGAADETGTLSVTTYADGEVRPDKRVCATFTSDHDDVDVSGARPCVSIANTDQVVLEVDDARVDEDDGMVTITVTSKKAVQGGFEAYIEHDGTGTADAEDYGIPVAYRTWTGTAGEKKTFTVGIVNDALSEGLETFGVRARINGLVTSVPSATQDTDAKWNGTVSIVDDDNDWISVSDATVEEGGKLVFKVKLEKARPGGARLKAAVRTVAGGATKNVDYTDKTKSVNFTGTKGETKEYKVRTIEDSVIEDSETLVAVVYESGDNKPVLAGGLGTITDDDAANVTVRVKQKAAGSGASGSGRVAMAASRAEVRERGWATAAQQQQAAKSGKVYEGHDLVYEAVLDKAVPGGFSFTPNLGGGTATSGTDYSNATGKLQFTGTAGETKEFTVSAYKDATVEGDEDYGVAAAVSATPHTVTVSKAFNSEILDADGADVTAQEVSAAEGDTLTFTARLNKKVAGGLTVTPSYTNVKSCGTGSSCKKAASGDYTANTAALSFTGTKGEEKTFTVATTENTTVELDKTFQVSLNVSNVNGTVSGGSAIATITNDDAAAVTVNDASESEGDSMTFTVTLDKAVDGGLTVTPGYTNGTAASGDYTANTTALTFTGTANETETFTVSTTEDAVLEANETFTVGLTVSDAPSGVTATDTGTGTITNDDRAAVTVDDQSAEEGGDLTFTVTLDKAVQGGLTVTPDFTDVTAVEGTDYTKNTAALTFTGTAGETKTFTVSTTEDAVLEAGETFTVGLTVSGTTLTVTATDTGTGTITNDDSAAVTVDDQSAEEGESATFTVTLSEAVQGGLTVTPSYTDVTAASTDYTENTGALTFTGTKGETQTFTVSTTEDAVLEAGETFTVGLTVSGTTLAVTATDTGTGTITNDDDAAVTVDDRSAEEGESLTFTVTLSEAVQGGLTVTLDFTDVTTVEGTDYDENTTALSFTGTKGETKTVTVTTTEDAVPENDETFTVGLTVSGTTLTVTATDTGTGTITDDDSAAVRVNDASVSEGGDLTFTVTLSKAVSGGLTVTPDFTDVSALEGTDYDENTGALSFTGTAGETKTFTVSTTEDAVLEANETFTVGLTVSGTTLAVTATDTGTGTITDDDSASVTVDDRSAEEGESATFTVTLSAAVQGGLTVTPDFTDVSAVEGTDYDENTGALSFTGTAGETKTFTVSTTEDAVLEAGETFTVGLTVSGTTLGVTATDTGTGTITNDDSATVTVDDQSASEGESATFTVTLSAAVQGGLTVTPDFTDVTADKSVDYTENTAALSFTGTKGETKTFTVTTTEDAVLEAGETFTVGLTVSGTTLGVTATDTGTGTITNDDSAVVTVDDQSASEGESATFTVTLSAAVQGGLTVTPDFTDVSAVEGTDYDENTAALSFTGTAGETKTFTVTTTEDAVLEADETFTVGLTVSKAPTGVTATDTGTGTITDDDSATVIVDDRSAEEGESATFTVTLSAAVQGGLTVTPDFTDVTAVEGTDYDENTAALSFTGTKGETQTFTVSTTEDAVLEAGETFTVGLTASNAPAGTTVTATDTGTGTITNDDSAAVTVDDRSAEEGESLTFTVTLSAAVQGGLTVTPDFTDVTAVEGTDYDENTAALSFAGTAGETQTFTVSTTEDAVLEAGETFTVGLTVSGTTLAVTATDTGTGTITNDDSAAVTVDDQSAEEGESATFTVTLSAAVQGGLTVTPDFTDVTAVEGTDYDENTAALSFTGTKGETKTFTVSITEDSVHESDETFTVGLTVSGAPSGMTATDTGTGTVEDDDGAAVRVNDASVEEGGDLIFTVTLSAAVQGGLTVTPSFTDASAEEGTDYDENTGALSFTGTAGETKTFTVSTTEDAVLEANETFRVGLTVSGAPSGVTATDTGTGTITDDDSAAVTVDDQSASEGESATFTVTLSAAVQGGLTVTPSFTDASAVEGTDYDENTGALSFTGTAGETKTFTVSTTEDAVLEGAETFTVGLTVSGMTLTVTATDTGTGTITDDDSAAVTVNDASASEGESMTFTVTLSAAVQGGLTVTPGYTNGTTLSTDYTANTAALSFTGTKGETKTFTVSTTEDTAVEGDETFTVGLTVSGAPSGVTATDTGTGTITDDDSATVTVDDASASEGESMTFTVTLDKAVSGGLTVTPGYTNGTAASADYTANTTALSFTGTKGETKTFTVATTEDAVLEADETFTVGLTVSKAPTGVTATDTGTGTITDDDSTAVTVDDASADEGGSMTFTVTLSEAVQGGLTVTPGFTDVSAVQGTDYDENTTALSFTGTAGETQTFTVSTTEDVVLEADETFTVGLTASNAPTGTTVTATDTGTGTINNDDSTVVTVNDANADEGESMTFTVTLSDAVQGGLTVTPSFTDVTAVEGTDYDENTTALSFTGTASETRTFTVSTTQDAVLEGSETFTVELSVSGTTLTGSINSTDTGTGTINAGTGNNLDTATLTIDDASASEGESMTFTVTLSDAVQGGLTVTPGYTNGTAASGDYTANTTALTFSGTKGETETFTVSTTEDAVLEANETFTVGLTVSNAPNGVTATDTGTGTINNDDSAAVTVNDASASEGDDITFTVTLSDAVQGGLKVTPSFTDGTAVKGTDYDENTTALSFTGTAHETRTFTVSTKQDAVMEANETFTVGLAVSDAPSGVTTTDTGTGTINNDDGATVTVNDASASEGASMTFTVTLGKAVQGGLKVTPDFTDATAVEGTDYDANTATLTFTGTANETQTFTVSTIEDAVMEANETFTVGLSVSDAPSGVTAADTGTGTINNDDSATVTIADANADEGNSMTFTVTLSEAVQGGLTVTPSFTDVTATKGTDYDENTAALSFTGTAGETKTFTVSITEDAVVEGDETFTVAPAISGLSTGVTGVTGTGTITDDDSTNLTLTANPASVAEGAGATTVTVTAATDGDTFKDDRTVTVSVGASGDSAVSGTDYGAVANFAITITAGQSSGTGTFTLTPTNDNMIEGDETITVAGTSSVLTVTGTSVTLADDDDTAVTLTVNPASVAEGAGATTVRVTAASDGDTFKTDRTVTVSVGTSGDGAVSGTDYGAVANFAITITAGQSSGTGTFTLTPTDDTEIEGDETITVAGTSTGLTVNGTSVTLEDDDFNIAAATTIVGSWAVEGQRLRFTVTLDNAVKGGFEVTPVITGGTATGGRDYSVGTGPLVFAGGAGEQRSFEIPTIDDQVVEFHETVEVSFKASDSRVSGVAESAIGVIADNDRATVRVSDARAEEGEELSFALTLDNAVAAGFLVAPVYTDGSAESGADYTENQTAVLFTGRAGERHRLTVTTIDDAVVEYEESFELGVKVNGAPLGVETESGTGTIEDDDEAVLTVTDARVEEGELLRFEVSVDKAVVGGFRVSPVYTDGSAEEGLDYRGNRGVLEFSGDAGERQSFTVPSLEDAVVEYEETFTVGVEITGAPAGLSAVEPGTGTIEDTTEAVLRVADARTEEGEELVFTVSLDKAVQGGFRVRPVLTEGSAAKGLDYRDNRTAVEFAGSAGESHRLTVTTVEDSVVEADETLAVGLEVLGAPSGVDVVSGRGVIEDDDKAVLTVTDARAEEGEALVFTVRLDNAVQGGFTVRPMLTGGSAAKGLDYRDNRTALEFVGSAGESHRLTVLTVEDAVVEHDETLAAGLEVLGAPSELEVVSGVGVIEDDDEAVVTVTDASAAEGEALTFTVTLDNGVQGGFMATPAFTDVSAEAGSDYTENRAALEFAGTAGETRTVTVSSVADAVVEYDETFTVSLGLSDAPGGLQAGEAATGTITDGTETVVRVVDARASEGEELVFTVTLEKAVVGGLTVTPSYEDVTALEGTDYRENVTALTFAGTAGESQEIAVSSVEDGLVEGDETFTVRVGVTEAPVGVKGSEGTGTVEDDDRRGEGVEVRVTDVSVEEGSPLFFTVSLAQAVTDNIVILRYATHDGTAHAGEDYTAVSGTFTFAAGETEKTVEVATLDDEFDEGSETMELRLSEAVNGKLEDPIGVGTIENDDPLPSAWLARFGRTVGEHVMGAIDARLHGDSTGSHLTVGGVTAQKPEEGEGRRRVGSSGLSEAGEWEGLARGEGKGAGWAGAPGDGAFGFGAAGFGSGTDEFGAAGPGAKEMTTRELLASSAFRWRLGGSEEGSGMQWTSWGSGAATRFDGRERSVSLDGEVVGMTLGVDAEWGPWTAGMALAYNDGRGTYDDAKSGKSGKTWSTLTSVHPYLRWQNERLSVWGLVGHGQGEYAMAPGDGEETVRTDMGMNMAGVGARRTLAPAPGGVELALRADGMFVWMNSDAVAGRLQETRTETRHLRLLLEGSRSFGVGRGGVLTPSLEAGVRHDAGDAERGFGLEVNARVRYEDTASGLAVEARGRGMIAHEVKGYEVWGASGSVVLDPGSDRLGLSLRVQPSWGAPESGVESLWDQGAAEGGSLGGSGTGARLDTELGYGLPALEGRGVFTLQTGFGMDDGGAHRLRVGGVLDTDEGLELSLSGEQTLPQEGEPEYEVVLGIRFAL